MWILFLINRKNIFKKIFIKISARNETFFWKVMEHQLVANGLMIARTERDGFFPVSFEEGNGVQHLWNDTICRWWPDDDQALHKR